jgi:hypothetical protein
VLLSVAHWSGICASPCCRLARPAPADPAPLTLALEGRAASTVALQAPGGRRQFRRRRHRDGASVIGFEVQPDKARLVAVALRRLYSVDPGEGLA